MTSETFPLSAAKSVMSNLREAALVELAVRRGEGHLASTGALTMTTGIHTGRSPNDKFTVRDAVHRRRRSGGTTTSRCRRRISMRIYADFQAAIRGKELFVQDLYAGADQRQRIKARIVTEFAWHALFIRHMLRRPGAAELASFAPDVTVVNLPSFKADPARHGTRPGSETVIAINFAKNLVLIGGSEYAGETKKSVFTYLNYTLPASGVMPMHCSANVDHGRRQRRVLRPLRHRQNDAFGRSQAHPARRRRARLVERRHLQLRGRLLR